MNEELEALNHIPPQSIDYEQWIMIGMALKDAGHSCQVWDEWSQGDQRYKAGECERKWNHHFNGSSNPVSMGSIVHIAKEFGYTPQVGGPNEAIEIGQSINLSYDHDYKFVDPNWVQGQEVRQPKDSKWDRLGELKKFLTTLFSPEDYISYVNDAWKRDESEKFLPSRSVNDRTVKELINQMNTLKDQEHNDQTILDYTFGNTKPEAGAWIRVNPMDGKGDKDSNVSEFKYALVESDDIDIDKQNAIIRELELPVATLSHSGGKSLHALVKVDALNMTEYKERVNFLFEICNKNNLKLDKQNRNPSRLSRLPGILRNGKKQYLVDTNIGKDDWVSWKEYIEELNDDLPDFDNLGDSFNDLPDLAPELIQGLLRKGHKMILQGASKAAKSFALIGLSVSIAEGKKWLNWECKKGKVLYVNLELDRPSCLHRFKNVYEGFGYSAESINNIDIWNLRGKAMTLDKLAPKLIRRAMKKQYSAIIVDPIYKVITGDENSAAEMAHFTNQFDKIALSVNASVIYCHHHSKGSQGGKKSSDRSSGSGVFARDPDAILDMIELHISDDLRKTIVNQTKCDHVIKYMDETFAAWRKDINFQDVSQSYPALSYHAEKMFPGQQLEEIKQIAESAESKAGKKSAWRIETSLREFEKADDVNLWFDYPIHRIDDCTLLDAVPEGEQALPPKWKAGANKEPAKKKKNKKALILEKLESQFIMGNTDNMTVDYLVNEFRDKKTGNVRSGYSKKSLITALETMKNIELNDGKIEMEMNLDF